LTHQYQVREPDSALFIVPHHGKEPTDVIAAAFSD
jgi:hypothetical protein